jgi:putative SOS response-associated peptidase YedK
MCVNYKPTDAELLEVMSGLSAAELPPWKEQVWQDYNAPILLAGQGGVQRLAVASYGMVPKDKMPPGKRLTTLNARCETIAEKRSYVGAWRAAQTCLVPTLAFYEPNWESGKAERWEIGMADGAPFYVAGLWRSWDDGSRLSFTQLTINADDHQLMKHFHKHGDEKRSLVIIPRDQADDWLDAGDPEIARAYLQLYPAELMAARPAEKGYGR